MKVLRNTETEWRGEVKLGGSDRRKYAEPDGSLLS